MKARWKVLQIEEFGLLTQIRDHSIVKLEDKLNELADAGWEVFHIEPTRIYLRKYLLERECK